MKKLFLSILAILLCLSAFALVACNGDDDTTTTNDVTTTDNVTTTNGDNVTTLPSYEYNITYELNGGTNNTENPTGYNTGDIITLAFPTKDDYMFMGWYTDSALTNEIKEINNKEENLTLYADWIPIDEILEFRLEDGEYTIRDYKKDVATLIIPSTYKRLPVTELDSTVFYGCVALEKIIIPSTITSMGEAIFDKCSSLTNIVVDVNNPSYKSIDGILYSKNEKTLVYYPEGKTEKEYSVPVGTEIIGPNSFNGNPHIETINIPNTVTQVRGIVDCTALKNINIPDSVTYIGGFRGCTSLKKIVLSNSITAIYRGAFLECNSLENVTLSNSLEVLPSDTFYECTSLKTITIPNSVKTIGDFAFFGCINLESIVLSDGVTHIGRLAGCNSLKSMILPDSVTFISQGIFVDCISLESVTLSNNLEIIPSHAFSKCTSLKNIVIPKNINTIEEYAFANCTSLESIVIPESVTTIKENIFYGSTNTIVYCEAESKPEGWSESWSYGAKEVIWGYDGE